MLYYFYGTDWMRAKLYLDDLKSKFAGFRLTSFNLEDEWENFCQAIGEETRTHNLFGGGLFMVVKTSKLLKDQVKFFQALKLESDNFVLVIWELANKPSWKPKTKNVEIKEFNELSLAGSRNWVNDYLKSKKLSVPDEVVEMLLEIFGSRLDFIVQELEKYSLLHASGVPVANNHGIATSELNEQGFFRWIQSVLEHDIAGIDKYAPSQEQTMQYLTGLINAARNVILSRGKVKESGANPYWLRKLVNWASGQTDKHLQDLFAFLLEFDLDVRSGKVDMERAGLTLKTRLISMK
jgi:DNA polymerase III delta subunit